MSYYACYTTPGAGFNTIKNTWHSKRGHFCIEGTCNNIAIHHDAAVKQLILLCHRCPIEPQTAKSIFK